ncbi:hypothetical protein RFI_02475 [Reticulomyxa filosa]|uniref:Uncharacterized protein n=1 Tax=Reticulomyxa filosa TaxID=46433 RepID=X6P973_RETFI|nr:hypothetical protein RFI_02475 [Reticulomyxa filosa]|eukprot:ETO34614.1 hypothetical protein RFI_02475 [Reticulomyxa filosa]
MKTKGNKNDGVIVNDGGNDKAINEIQIILLEKLIDEYKEKLISEYKKKLIKLMRKYKKNSGLQTYFEQISISQDAAKQCSQKKAKNIIICKKFFPPLFFFIKKLYIYKKGISNTNFFEQIE